VDSIRVKFIWETGGNIKIIEYSNHLINMLLTRVCILIEFSRI
jgi:hypothetical protein